MSVSQCSWDPINQLGHITFVSCTKFQTEWTSRLFVVSLKIFLANLWGFFFYFFNGKICVDLIGLVEDGVSYHQFLREVIFCVAGAFVRVHMCLSKGIAR